MQIYTSVGYSERDAAKSILEHNLYGLDIDDRAYQLAYFAVMMKARQYNRRILNGENTCHVHAIQESNPINRAHLKFFGAGLDDLEKNTAKMQLEGLLDILTDAKEYGSILNVPEYNWALLRRFVGGIDDEVQISLESAGVEQTAEELQKLIDLGETMAQKYGVAATNPPYLNSGNMPEALANYAKKEYPNSKTDLYSIFMEKAINMVRSNEFIAMITQQSWMFLNYFENLRKIYLKTCIINMAHLGTRAFSEIGGEVVQTTTFVVRKVSSPDYVARYSRLTYYGSEELKKRNLKENENTIYACEKKYYSIPGKAFAYWISDETAFIFENAPQLKEFAEPRAGLQTGENDTFLRLWEEIPYETMGFNCRNAKECIESGKKWFPYSKGGAYRRWFGNFDYVVDWYNDGENIKKDKIDKLKRGLIFASNSKPKNVQYYFREGITWSTLSGADFAARWHIPGALFDIKGSTCFFDTAELEKYTLGLMNSKVFNMLLQVISPTLDYNAGYIGKVPVKINESKSAEILSNVNINIKLSKEDWDAFETSWDFKAHPLVKLKMAGAYAWGDNEPAMRIESAYKAWEETCNGRFEKLKANEEELNRIFIDIYGLQDELTPEVEDKDVTVRKADLQRDIKSLLSYAVGCMFGRYSLDVPGLVLAGQPFEEKFVHASNAVTGTGVLGAPGLLRAPGALYLRTEDGVKQCTFAPDVDNVIPITDEEYLEDDIIARLCDWLKVVYGADTLEANLDYIAKALGNKGTTSREIIRNYFVNDFFKDHCQTYSVTGSGKRPIYWLFDSGKQNGFKALVYLHRYTPDTIGTLRVDYLHKMQRVYESEINRMQDMMDHTTNAREAAAASKRKDKLTKQLKECRDYDEKISHLALSRIALDLDDGVKVNYRKLQTAADGKFYEVLADSKNIMVKEKK